MDLSAIRENTRIVTQSLPAGCALMAVAKADAYGHGAVRLAREWRRCGVETLCVASLDEAIELREGGIDGDILILGYTCPDDADALAHYDLIQTVVDAGHGNALAQSGRPVRAHIKVDTGMNRLGIQNGEAGEIMGLLRLPGLRVEGIFTHFFAADDRGAEAVHATHEQAERFLLLVKKLRRAGFTHLKTHMQSSYGIYNYPGLRCDGARAGLALFGGLEAGRLLGAPPPLKAALSVRARIEHVARVAAGEGVGYGPAFVARRDSRIATVSIGYGDGIPRALSHGKGRALLPGGEAPMVGLVCMDRLHIDVTDLGEVRQGETVTLLGRAGGREITVAELARRADTIPNEIFSRLGPRLARLYPEGAAPGRTGELPRRVPQYTR